MKRVASQLVNLRAIENQEIASTRRFAFCPTPSYPQAIPLRYHTQHHQPPRRCCTVDPNLPFAHAQHSQRRSLSGTTPLRMATDDEYMDFLNKANEDPGQGSASTQAQGSHAKKELKAADHGADIPQPLVKATKDAFYMSDSDEPFVPVSLAWEKGEGLPDEEEIAKLVGHWDPAKAEVEILDPVDWDRNGQYKEVIDAVREAGKGNDVRVYRIVKDNSRVEYFVVTRAGEGKGARLVGVKALAIES
ncbi:hypothetical protein LA080_008578 [Diaporthe eres]|uniref:Uncharacterized protein n=1 Tax=Diaporthe vaccinii TaxID=105482 RepID=A0ABR4F5V6_9PEZI|nr:hypothetical protein LA080_008578 [Diaporthe eres]